MENQSQESFNITGESIDLCIEDTQGAANDMLMQHTQVDDGFSDEDDESNQNYDNMYGSTQVDEDYFSRMLENEEIIQDDDRIKEVIVNVEQNINTVEHKANSQGTEETDDEVDFCIADTQAPINYDNILEPDETTLPNITKHHDEVKADINTSTYMQESHLTVYDYLSLSAPMSTSDGVKTTTSAHIQSTPIFSALETTPIEITLPVPVPVLLTSVPATTVPGELAVEEEEPTQLDGSSLVDSEHALNDTSPESKKKTNSMQSEVSPIRSQQNRTTVVQARVEESETFVSAPPSAEKAVRSNRSSSSNNSNSSSSRTGHGVKAITEVPLRSSIVFAAPQSAAAGSEKGLKTTTHTQEELAESPLQRAETSSNSEFMTDWISAKSGKPLHPVVNTAYYVPELIAAPPATVTAPVPVPSTLAPALTERSLDELLRMQEELQRLIQSKAAKHSNVQDTCVPQQPEVATTTATTNHKSTESGMETTTTEAAVSTTAVPLQRQDTSYGMSQPSNIAISGLLRLREAEPYPTTTAPTTTAPTTAAHATAVPSSATSDPTPSLGRPPSPIAATSNPSAMSPAALKHTTFSPFLYNSNGVNKSLTASADATTASAASTPSPGHRKFFKRKFASGRSPLPPTTSTTVAATTTGCGNNTSSTSKSTSAAAAAGMAWDDDDDAEEVSDSHSDNSNVASPTSPTHTTTRITTTTITGLVQQTTAVSSSSHRTTTTTTTPTHMGKNSRGKARKVIRETQDEDNNNATGSEAEFDESDFLDAPVRSHSNAPTGSRTDSGGSGTKGAQLPKDFPPSFLIDIPESFTELWHALVRMDWYWKRGGGIVSYYYVRPGCQVRKGYLMGRDYFGDEEEVRLFVHTIVTQCRERLGIKPVKKVVPPLAGATTATVEKEVEKEVVGGGAPNNTNTTDKHNPTTTTTTVSIPSTAPPHTLTSQPSTASQAPTVDPIMQDINRIPWKYLWKMLRDREWTWDFGSQLSNYYFAPGFGIKSPDTIMGVNKFDSEESVRRFIKKQKWPEFHSNVPERQASSSADSQPLDAYMNDPSWQLLSHRKKRKKHSSSRWTAEETTETAADEGSVSVSGSEQGGAKRGNKKQRKESQNVPQAASTGAIKPTSNSSGSSSRSKQVATGTTTSGMGRPPVAPSGRLTGRLASQGDDYGAATQPQMGMSPVRGSHADYASSHSSSSGINQRRLFAGQRYVISGVPEKLKSQLSKDITKRGGTILPSVPVDGNESQHDPIVLDEKTGEAGVKGPVVVISHPGEFRKPNYLMALTTGVALVHYQWVRDSIEYNALQELADYQLPTGCTALHSYNIFTRPDRMALSCTQEPLSNAILANIKVLNFAGSSWDNLLLASGATTVQKSTGLVQGIGNGSGSSSKLSRSGGARMPVDLILVDPNEYAQTVAALKLPTTHSSSSTTSSSRSAVGRYTTPNSLLMHLGSTNTTATASAGSCSTPKSPNLKMGEDELAAVQRCLHLHSSHTSNSTAVPLLVTTDWLVHSIAVGYLLDYNILDIFTLPSVPEKQPFTYKADAITGSGERYTKYDIVFYSTTTTTHNNRHKHNSPTKRSNSTNIPGSDASLSVGKIIEFVRRDLRSPLYARIRPLITTTTTFPLQIYEKNKISKEINHSNHINNKQLVGDPNTPVRLVEVEKLAGKAVLLSRSDFLKVSKYSLTDHTVYCAAAEWHEENPSVLVGEGGGADRECEGGMQGQEEEPLMRVQRSQDY